MVMGNQPPSISWTRRQLIDAELLLKEVQRDERAFAATIFWRDVREVGVASSSLTFFQQIGGTIGLTIAGTLFDSRLLEEIPTQLAVAGVPPQIIAGFQQGAGNVDFTGTGNLGETILANTPEQFRPIVEPLIPQIVTGIHEAFSIAVASTFWIGIAGAAVAAIAVLFLKEIPMRTTWEMPPETVEEKDSSDSRTGATAGEGAPA